MISTFASCAGKISLFMLALMLKICPSAYDFLNLFFNFVVEVTLRENPDFDPTLKHDCLMFLG